MTETASRSHRIYSKMNVVLAMPTDDLRCSNFLSFLSYLSDMSISHKWGVMSAWIRRRRQRRAEREQAGGRPFFIQRRVSSVATRETPDGDQFCAGTPRAWTLVSACVVWAASRRRASRLRAGNDNGHERPTKCVCTYIYLFIWPRGRASGCYGRQWYDVSCLQYCALKLLLFLE